MTSTAHRPTFAHGSTPPPVHDPDPTALRPILTFAAVALPIGWILLSLPVLLDAPQEPFALASILLALLPAALVITARRSGGAGVRALLRDAVRLPRPLWWAFPAVTAIPVVTWVVASLLGEAKPLTTSLLMSFLFQLVTGAVVINIWEETVWAGFVQRRAMARWGTLPGSLVTALMFVAIHVPLAFDDAATTAAVVEGMVMLLVAGVAMRLLVAAMDSWTAGSLLTLGFMHSSFNVTDDLIEPSYDWLRLGTALVLGLAAVIVLLRARRAR